jgi:hypothetical protein
VNVTIKKSSLEEKWNNQKALQYIRKEKGLRAETINTQDK